MIINHNLSAMNTHRQLGANNNAVSKSLEKLSSGLQINRAGDDAAGLAISEKMRAQIKGLDMATKNAQDGISLIQTAEGALTETHAILQRMRELAVQSASDTNEGSVDRKAMQSELDELVKEINDIAGRTEFNTQNLLEGNFKDKTFHIGANKGQNITVSIDAMNAKSIGLSGEVKVDVTELNQAAVKALDGLNAYDGAAVDSFTNEAGDVYLKANDGNYYALADVEVGSSNPGTTDNDLIVAKDGAVALESFEVTEGTETNITVGGKNITITAGDTLTDGNGEVLAVKVDVDGVDTFVALSDVKLNEAGDGLEAKAGAEAYEFAAGDIIAGNGKLSISTQKDADKAIETINEAINVVSTQRANLGAIQNRLEHTINNLGASSENLSAAEARIRDVDMAKEMMNFTKNNILTQAAQAMLAQANQTPQGVLQLLR